MTKILLLIAAAAVATAAHAQQGDVAATLQRFGLLGTWASYCTPGTWKTLPGFRIVVAAPAGAAPTYTTISSDGTVAITVHSVVLAASPTGDGGLKLKLRIAGGDRDGGPLPSPTTNTFEQAIERDQDGGIRIAGVDQHFIRKCPEE